MRHDIAQDERDSGSADPRELPSGLAESDAYGTGDPASAALDETPFPQPQPGPWSKRLAFTIIPLIAILLGAAAGFLKWESASRAEAQTAAIESVQAARDSTAAMLSYNANSVEKDLNAARDRLTGSFLDSYSKLINEVVIPGAKEKAISAVAQVPEAASVSASASHAVALVFVDQTITIGRDAPTSNASSVRVTLDKVGDRWLVSGFDPI
jgi:Mce-associated membrane protein